MQTSPQHPDGADDSGARPETDPHEHAHEYAHNHEQATVTREVEIDADTEAVWEAISTNEGRERWIEPDPDRVLIIDADEPPSHLSWWWWSADEPARHVDVRVVSIPAGTRVIVTETAPASFPMAQMVASLHPVLALVGPLA
jgi:uncharacterized protein YndB with AHSA1/START domain